MNKRRYLLLGLLFLVIALAVKWSISCLYEPVYKGQRLGLWLKGYSSGHSLEADEAVRQMGTNCLPLLLRRLGARPRGWTNQFALPLPLFDARVVEARRAQAAQAFEVLGEGAWPAVPALIEIYQQNLATAPGRAAARALCATGAPATNAVPFLLRGATNADPAARVVAVGTLSQIHSAPEQVVPVLIGALNDPDQEVRNMAAFTLACYRKEAKPAIPALLGKLKDPYWQVRGNAILALAEAQAPVALALPALTTALQDPHGFVRARAAQALGTFGADAIPARKAMIQLLSDPDKGVRDHVTQSLRSIGIDPEAAAKEGR